MSLTKLKCHFKVKCFGGGERKPQQWAYIWVLRDDYDVRVPQTPKVTTDAAVTHTHTHREVSTRSPKLFVYFSNCDLFALRRSPNWRAKYFNLERKRKKQNAVVSSLVYVSASWNFKWHFVWCWTIDVWLKCAPSKRRTAICKCFVHAKHRKTR